MAPWPHGPKLGAPNVDFSAACQISGPYVASAALQAIPAIPGEMKFTLQYMNIDPGRSGLED